MVTALEVAGVESFVRVWLGLPGRPPCDRAALARAFVAKAVIGLPTTAMLTPRSVPGGKEAIAAEALARRTAGYGLASHRRPFIVSLTTASSLANRSRPVRPGASGSRLDSTVKLAKDSCRCVRRSAQ